VKFQEIPLNKIELGRSQARIRKVTEDIDELVSSINKWGLLQPVTVTVSSKDKGKYELIAGQRRYLAVKQLGWNTIRAEIIDTPESSLQAKMLSLSENLVRKEMIDLDTIDAVTEAFRTYGTKKATSEATGLSVKTITKYVKFDSLPKKVQNAVIENKIGMNDALKASGALNWDSDQGEEDKVLQLAEEYARLSGTEKDQLTNVVKSDPAKPIDKMIKEARKPKNKKELKITFWAEDFDKLSTYSEAEQLSSPEDAAYNLIIDGLKAKGYQ
jgi:ParB family transcriptional regulator, chromosome partitioning protein